MPPTTPDPRGKDDTQHPVDDITTQPRASLDETTLPREADAATTETRMDIAPILATAKEGAEEASESPLETEATRRANIRMGNQYLDMEMLGDARIWYTAAGATEQLIHLCDRLIEREQFGEARSIFVEMGIEMPAEKFEAAGDACFARRKFSAAHIAYVCAGATEKLLTLGDACFEQGQDQVGEWAYRDANTEVPAGKFEIAGDACFKAGLMEQASRNYKRASATEKLIAVGDKCLETGDLTVAVEAYSAAGTKDKLVAVGDAWFEQGRPDAALKVYARAGATEKRVMVGDLYLKRGMVDDARDAYKYAGEEILQKKAGALAEANVKRGDYWLREKKYDLAINHYVAAGLDVAREKLIACGDMLLEAKNFEPALRAYTAAGVALPQKTLLAIANGFDSHGQRQSALETYIAAGSVEDLVRIGRYYRASDTRD
ncbi:MAG TPA: hypothetical protein VNN25_24915, partial [Thermoanaerobaculia bacterium]|nr:hypothetical protein [Thermoanaerobaculia bacterium]